MILWIGLDLRIFECIASPKRSEILHGKLFPIGANLAEGLGRGSYVENRRFARIARGSLFEVKHWLRGAYKRDLLTKTEIEAFQILVEELTPRLSAYINSISKKAHNQ